MSIWIKEWFSFIPSFRLVYEFLWSKKKICKNKKGLKHLLTEKSVMQNVSFWKMQLRGVSLNT